MSAETIRTTEPEVSSAAAQKIIERIQSATVPSETKGWGFKVASLVLDRQIPETDVARIEQVAALRFSELTGQPLEPTETNVAPGDRAHTVTIPAQRWAEDEPARDPDWRERALPRGDRD